MLLNFLYCLIFMLDTSEAHGELERNLKLRFNDSVSAFTLLEELPIDVSKRILVPDSFSLNLKVKNGPEEPTYARDEDVRKANGARFKDECVERGIIPNSHLEIEACSPDFVFAPERFTINTPKTRDEDYQRRESMKLVMALLNGGVPYGIGINAPGYQFEMFRNDLLPRLKETYVIHGGAIVYTTHRGGCPDGGYYSGSTLNIGERSARLNLEDSFDDMNAHLLVGWFRLLELKAGGQLELLRD